MPDELTNDPRQARRTASARETYGGNGAPGAAVPTSPNSRAHGGTQDGWEATRSNSHRRLESSAERARSDEWRLEQATLRFKAELVGLMRQLHAAEVSNAQLASLVGDLGAQVESARSELEGIKATKTFRYTVKARSAYSKLRRATMPPPPDEVVPDNAPNDAPIEDRRYERWIELYDTMDARRRRAIRDRLAKMVEPPSFSVVVPVFNTPVPLLRSAIESVRSQLYQNWELCIADDGSTTSATLELLDECSSDKRIKVVRREQNGHICAATNSALEVASGDWIAFLDHDDELAEHALALAAVAIEQSPDAVLLYSDEDKIDESGRRHSPHLKSDFDPLLVLGQNYLNHLTIVRRDMVERVGRLRPGFEGSQDWDLVLRVIERTSERQILHLPFILYHWRDHGGSTASSMEDKPYAKRAGEIAVSEYLERQGMDASVTAHPMTGWNRVRWHLPGQPPKVSLVIPTRDGRFLARCIESVVQRTSYSNYEIIVVDNGSVGVETLRYLRNVPSIVRVIRDERPFNFSQLNNDAVLRSDSPLVCLLNDDTEVIHGDWLQEMVGQVLRPGVGAVGAKLLYSDGRIQHAGVVLGPGGVAGHIHLLSDRLSAGYFGRLQLARTYSAVTAACMLVRREVWDQVGGLDTDTLAIAFNDVDLCIRIREAGWRIAWTPWAELYHHESVTRGPDTEGAAAQRFEREVGIMQARWGSLLRDDPSYNPNLSLELIVAGDEIGLAWPPRVGIEQYLVSDN